MFNLIQFSHTHCTNIGFYFQIRKEMNTLPGAVKILQLQVVKRWLKLQVGYLTNPATIPTQSVTSIVSPATLTSVIRPPRSPDFHSWDFYWRRLLSYFKKLYSGSLYTHSNESKKCNFWQLITHVLPPHYFILDCTIKILGFKCACSIAFVLQLHVSSFTRFVVFYFTRFQSVVTCPQNKSLKKHVV